MDILAEHEAAPKEESSSNAYNPSPEDKKDIDLVNKLFEKSKKWRKQYDEKWVDFYKMFRGKQWGEQRPSYRHSEVINMVFRNIQSVVPIITDSRPKFEFLPQEPSDQEIAEILNELAESDWQKNNWLMTLTECVYDAHFYGTAFASMEFDPKENNGAGGIVFDSEDPFYCFPDPNGRNINDSRSKFFIHAEPIDVDILKKEYPDKKHLIKADLIDLNSGDKNEINEVKYKSPSDTATVIESTNSAYDLGDGSKTLKIVCYHLCDEETEEESQGPDGAPQYTQKLKYPRGRKLVVANNILLYSGPIPYDDKKFPFARLVNYILPREFYGMSEIEQLQSPQKIFNKLVSFSLDVLTLMGNPIWKVSTSANLDTDNLFNRPGLVLEVDGDINQVRREEGVQLQPYVMNLIDLMAQKFNEIAGDNDVSRGVKPEGVTAASAIQSLQEAAQTRLRLKSRVLDCFLQEIGQLYKSRVFQFKTAPEVSRLTGKDGAQKYFKFHMENQFDEAGNLIPDKHTAHVSKYSQDPVTGKMIEGESKSYEIAGDFDVRVTTGSSLPFAKLEKFSMAKELFGMGIIDQEEVLKAADWPNWEAILERQKQQQAEMAQMQASQGAPPQGPAPQGAPQ